MIVKLCLVLLASNWGFQVELDAVLNVTCTRCGGRGHLKTECYGQLNQKYDILEEEEGDPAQAGNEQGAGRGSGDYDQSRDRGHGHGHGSSQAVPRGGQGPGMGVGRGIGRGRGMTLPAWMTDGGANRIGQPPGGAAGEGGSGKGSERGAHEGETPTVAITSVEDALRIIAEAEAGKKERKRSRKDKEKKRDKDKERSSGEKHRKKHKKRSKKHKDED